MQAAPHFIPQGQPITAVQPSGRTKALLIGINYTGTRAELKGCINDVHKMRKFLVGGQFRDSPDTMVCLTDDAHSPQLRPTRANILNALGWLTNGVQPGDCLFFHFSGHGAQQRDPTGAEEDGMDETICPEDYERGGMITDDQLFDRLVAPLPSGVRLTAVMDCCHSGTGLDLPWIHARGQWIEEDNPRHSLGDVQLFSGCEDSQTSADAHTYGRAGGAMTTAFVDVVTKGETGSYPQLMDALHRSLQAHGFSQRPLLSASQPFNFQRPFYLQDIHPNVNPQIGRMMRKRKKPRRDFGNSGTGNTIMGGAAGLIGGVMLMDMLDGDGFF